MAKTTPRPKADMGSAHFDPEQLPHKSGRTLLICNAKITLRRRLPAQMVTRDVDVASVTQANWRHATFGALTLGDSVMSVGLIIEWNRGIK